MSMAVCSVFSVTYYVLGTTESNLKLNMMQSFRGNVVLKYTVIKLHCATVFPASHSSKKVKRNALFTTSTTSMQMNAV